MNLNAIFLTLRYSTIIDGKEYFHWENDIGQGVTTKLSLN